MEVTHKRKKKRQRCSLALLMCLFKSRCFYCSNEVSIVPVNTVPYPSDAATRDHYIPRSHSGPNKVSNIVLCCSKCNHIKASYDPSDVFPKFNKEEAEKRINEIAIIRTMTRKDLERQVFVLSIN